MFQVTAGMLALALACSGDKDDEDSGDDGGGDGGGADGGSDGGGADGGGADGGGADGGGADGGAGEGLDWDPTGRVYRADMTSGTWTGHGSGAPFFKIFVERDLLFEVLGVDGELSLRVGWTDAKGKLQEPCLATGETQAPLEPLPAWETEPISLDMMSEGFTIPLQELVLSGTFGEDGDPIDDLGFSALIDFRDWSAYLSFIFGSSSASQACDLMVGFGAECEACPSDGEVLCLGVEGIDFYAVETDLLLEARSAKEVEVDPRCP